ncbi:hypothetical protein Pfo_027358 [Paulownia fortunei]|nr:hypothetical protein Pfo_027358 [Paulownia fortunei]
MIRTADPEFNHFLLGQDGKLVNTWSMDTFAEMATDFAARQIFSGDFENAPLKISDMFRDLVEGLMSFTINIPGTAHHKCLQAEHETIIKKRENPDSTLTRDEYKSMRFTLQV